MLEVACLTHDRMWLLQSVLGLEKQALLLSVLLGRCSLRNLRSSALLPELIGLEHLVDWLVTPLLIAHVANLRLLQLKEVSLLLRLWRIIAWRLVQLIVHVAHVGRHANRQVLNRLIGPVEHLLLVEARLHVRPIEARIWHQWLLVGPN